MTRSGWWVGLAATALMVASIACGGGGTPPPPVVPSIANINSSTSPSSPTGVAIEINGSNFGLTPGQVVFTQASPSVTTQVTPTAAGWSDTGIVVVVPTGSASTAFTLPGSVTVQVVTAKGTSNTVNLVLVQVVQFAATNITWAQTTALPNALAGLRAVTIPGATTSSAYVVVAGGWDGAAIQTSVTGNQTSVWSNTLNADGTLGANWTTIATNPLPAARAHHGMVVAHPGNSPVAANARYVYVIGGQASATDAPGGTNTVYRASVDPATGAVGAWAALSSTLPQSLVGSAVTLYNGNVYVIGGLTPNGTSSSAIYSAPIQADGTLGAWTTAANPYPLTISFATAFGFGGNLYVLSGHPTASTTPNAQTIGIPDVRVAPVRKGVIGVWTLTSPTVQMRAKHVAWIAFGQVLDAEGIYNGTPGSGEFEYSSIKADGTLDPWIGMTGANASSADVYNAAAAMSPLRSAAGTPRFLLLGGQAFTQSPTPGALSTTVYYNNAP